jgi:endogenous inhibitor of DNA gyrase (YacG/DUF329 family)
MIRVSCPICGKAIEIASIDQLPSFPFCSARCKLVDLGRWIDGAYAIPENASPSLEESALEENGTLAEDEE